MAATFAVGQLTHRGQVRELNEDSLCVLVPPDLAPDLDALFVVADGMGGHNHGEVASGFVIEKFKQLFTSQKYREWVDHQSNRQDYYILALKEIIEKLNAQLYQMSSTRADLQGMGTTVTAALVKDGNLYIGHVGDTRAYLVSNGEWKQLTEDHSWVMEQVKDGQMTLAQAESDSRKNRLMRALGITNVVRVDRIVESLKAGDVLLLCSDGLVNHVKGEEIMGYARNGAPPQQICQTLVDLANQRGGHDNITVIIARVLAQGQPNSVPVQVAQTNSVSPEISGLVTQKLPAPLPPKPPSPPAVPVVKPKTKTVAPPPKPTTLPESSASVESEPMPALEASFPARPTKPHSLWRERLLIGLVLLLLVLFVGALGLFFGKQWDELIANAPTLAPFMSPILLALVFTVGLGIGLVVGTLRGRRT